MEMEWTREKIKECLEVLKNLPDFDNLPLPDSWGSLYNIPITPARALDLKDYIHQHQKSRFMVGNGDFEIREPAPGGVREVKGEDPPILEVTTHQIGDESQEEMPEMLEDSKESTEKEKPDYQALSTTPSPENDD
jgi:hypothetical protein